MTVARKVLLAVPQRDGGRDAGGGGVVQDGDEEGWWRSRMLWEKEESEDVGVPSSVNCI